jgi:FemAB-related protein (PEP-CTERM system-associated)
MEAANQWADRRGVSHIEYRDDMPREGLPVRSEKVSMILPLPSSPSQLWNRFTSKLRSQIRRPQREDPYLVSGGPERLDDFYKVFARNMRDLGTPVYGKAFFRNILTTFPENSWVTVMYLRKQPVSAGFLIGYGQTLEIPWASTIRDVNHLSVNMLLYWEVLKAAIERGYQHFDFGRSSRDASTFRFKQQWGARPKQLYWHYWLREDRELPALSPSNHKYAMLIALWKRLPVPVANRLGPPVVKNLP